MLNEHLVDIQALCMEVVFNKWRYSRHSWFWLVNLWMES